MTPIVVSPPLASPSQESYAEAPLQLHDAESESLPTKLRRSSQIRKPPQWKNSGDYVLY